MQPRNAQFPWPRLLAAAGTMVVLPLAGSFASAQPHLGPRERRVPVCTALAAAVRRMPPSTDGLTWTAQLPPIRGVTRPVWTKLDPLQHMDVLLAAYFNSGWAEVLHPARAKELREKYGAEIEARIRSGIADGTVVLEETSVPTIRLEDAPDLAEPMGLYRVTSPTWSDFTIAGRRPNAVWSRAWIVVIKSLPTTHAYDLRPINKVINTGEFGSMDVLVVEGRPLFIGMPDGAIRRYVVLGNRFLGNQIATDTGTDLELCNFEMDSRTLR